MTVQIHRSFKTKDIWDVWAAQAENTQGPGKHLLHEFFTEDAPRGPYVYKCDKKGKSFK